MTKKICVKITASKDNRKIIYVCLDGIEKISKEILIEKESKFRMIAESIFRNISNRDMYQKYPEYKGTAVMKLSKKGKNLRINCKVKNEKDASNHPIQRITMVILHSKRNQKLSNKEKQILQSIQNRNYEYKEWYQPT